MNTLHDVTLNPQVVETSLGIKAQLLGSYLYVCLSGSL